MDYEKLYKEALERAKRNFSNEVVTGIFPELKNEDERIRKEIIDVIRHSVNSMPADKFNERIAWLEKQGEHARFREAIQVGDHVTKNEDGELVNLSQLKRVAKPSEQKPAEKPVWYDNMDDLIADGMIDEIQKSDLPEGSKHNRIYWINKHRIQPKQEWSEEDEYYRNIIMYCLNGESVGNADKENAVLWLKSFRPQPHWKPSEEQMAVLNEVINFAADHGTMRWNDYIYNVLKSLREQLKKL